jgi:CRISPR system Cascade subunit CasE
MSTLHLIRLPISLSALARWAASRNYGWTTRRDKKGSERDAGFDEGCAIHHLLVETFGKGALHPFRMLVASPGKQGHVYAYSRADAATLLEIAQACALPEVAGVCDLAQLAAKSMPETWRAGRRLGFETRVRPVSRLMKPLPHSGGNAFAKGAELDVFLIEAMRRFPEATSAEENMLKAGRSREAVYTDWLAQKLEGIATLAPGVRLARFVRNRAARTGHAPEGPDATLQGDLIVDDPLRFQDSLANGLGRHKAYGYGMLLLRPPRST